MKKLFDETFSNEDHSQISRNIWYGYAELAVGGDYGKVLKLDEKVMDKLGRIIQSNLSEPSDPRPTETNWYFYGNTQTKDAINDSIRPSIMVREKESSFVVHCNFSDHDFAMNLDHILNFKNEFENYLSNMTP